MKLYVVRCVCVRVYVGACAYVWMRVCTYYLDGRVYVTVCIRYLKIFIYIAASTRIYLFLFVFLCPPFIHPIFYPQKRRKFSLSNIISPLKYK